VSALWTRWKRQVFSCSDTVVSAVVEARRIPIRIPLGRRAGHPWPNRSRSLLRLTRDARVHDGQAVRVVHAYVHASHGAVRVERVLVAHELCAPESAGYRLPGLFLRAGRASEVDRGGEQRRAIAMIVGDDDDDERVSFRDVRDRLSRRGAGVVDVLAYPLKPDPENPRAPTGTAWRVARPASVNAETLTCAVRCSATTCMHVVAVRV